MSADPPATLRTGATLAGVAAGALAFAPAFAAGVPHVVAVVFALVVAALVATGWVLHARAERADAAIRAERDTLAAAQARADALEAQLAHARADRESLASDLALLGSYGNLLLESTDLAEALQISQQMLSRLLPGCAGSIYPLIDGEGLSEATHLWGTHAGETKPQATWNDCRALGINRPHSGGSLDPWSLCAHVVHAPSGGSNGHAKPPAPAGDAAVPAFSTACIPLQVQTDSLGWLYLSAPGNEGVPKLTVAIAAAEQLSQALANLRLRENLRDLSVRDPLTGLFNRRYLAESLGREMARSKRRHQSLTVMTMDLDHFKAFNDSFGHAAGDAVLVAFSRLLHNNFRSEDIACRLGGEEFVMIMPEMDRPVAERRAEEMLQATAAIRLVHEGQALPPITVSIGLAMFPDDGEDPDQLMQLADQALYRAKTLGRNRLCFAGAG
jgi:diguanylate cyclase (GGDEF)-like protein